MKIIILGAGQVGISTAEILAKEENDITLIDNVASQVEGLQDRLDIRTIVGSASHPSVLEQAGGPDADLILAVTDQDEVNMAACQVAYTLFRTLINRCGRHGNSLSGTTSITISSEQTVI